MEAGRHCRNCGKKWSFLIEDKYYYCKDCADKNNCICKDPFQEAYCNKHWYISQKDIDLEKAYSKNRERKEKITDLLHNLLAHRVSIREAVDEIIEI